MNWILPREGMNSELHSIIPCLNFPVWPQLFALLNSTYATVCMSLLHYQYPETVKQWHFISKGLTFYCSVLEQRKFQLTSRLILMITRVKAAFTQCVKNVRKLLGWKHFLNISMSIFQTAQSKIACTLGGEEGEEGYLPCQSCLSLILWWSWTLQGLFAWSGLAWPPHFHHFPQVC